MKSLIVLFLLSGLCTTSVYAKDIAEFKQDRLIARILHQQVKRNVSIQSSVSAILTRFPEQVDSVLKIALRKYPTKYRQIMIGAMNAEPVLACEVIRIVLKANVASNDEVIAIAVAAEPAYAQEIVNIAVLNSPADIENIVRVAIETEPFVSDAVIHNTMSSFPEKIYAILSGAIQALPEQVSSFVRNTINLFPGSSEDVVTKAVTSSQPKHAQQIVASAVQAGLDHESAINAAIAGGAKREQLAKID